MKHKKLREIYKWSSNLDVLGNRRKEPKVQLLKDLNILHIKAIIVYMEDRVQKVFDYHEEVDVKYENFIIEMKASLIDEFETVIDIMNSEIKYRNKNNLK